MEDDPYDRLIHKNNLRRQELLNANAQNANQSETLSQKLSKFIPSGIRAYLNFGNQK